MIRVNIVRCEPNRSYDVPISFLAISRKLMAILFELLAGLAMKLAPEVGRPTG